MKKSVNLFIFLIAAFVFSGCEEIINKEKDCLVSGMYSTYDNDTDTALYTYDNHDRLIRVDFGSGWYTTWEYAIGRVTEINFTFGEHSSTIVYTLNNDGNAMSSIRTPGGETEPESSTSYDYDEEGYLIETTEISADDPDDIETVYYEYEEGNLVYRERENYYTDYYSETEYEYYLDQVNKFTYDISFLGKHNTNLVKKSTLTTDIMTLISNYTYQLNDDGYVTHEVMTAGTSVMEMDYTYDCE